MPSKSVIDRLPATTTNMRRFSVTRNAADAGRQLRRVAVNAGADSTGLRPMEHGCWPRAARY